MKERANVTFLFPCTSHILQTYLPSYFLISTHLLNKAWEWKMSKDQKMIEKKWSYACLTIPLCWEHTLDIPPLVLLTVPPPPSGVPVPAPEANGQDGGFPSLPACPKKGLALSQLCILESPSHYPLLSILFSVPNSGLFNPDYEQAQLPLSISLQCSLIIFQTRAPLVLLLDPPSST